jgi:hypothetical protein
MSLTTTAGGRRVAGLIRGARAELAVHGWHQGDLVSDTGCLCVVGALRRAAGVCALEEPTDPDALRLLWEAQRELARPLQLAGEVPGRLEPIEVLSLWNDRPGRSRAHVLAHLDTVAADLSAPADEVSVPCTVDGARHAPAGCGPREAGRG